MQVEEEIGNNLSHMPFKIIKNKKTVRIHVHL